MIDHQVTTLLGIVYAALAVASVVTHGKAQRQTFSLAQPGSAPGATARAGSDLQARVKAWWVMVIIITLALLFGFYGTLLLFLLISFLALREYVSAIPTSRNDHRALFWAFFIILPAHYFILATGNYDLFSIFIPVYVSIFIPARLVISADPKRFLERASVLQWGLLTCVYLVSHTPALLILPKHPGVSGGALVLVLLIVVEGCDVFQYVFGKTFGRNKIAPVISPKKTWEGFWGGVAAAALLGLLLAWATPFSALGMALLGGVLGVCGFFGDLTMSAIKRDHGIKDFGNLIEGHGGILDRIDSLCFAAPVFFHAVRYWHG